MFIQYFKSWHIKILRFTINCATAAPWTTNCTTNGATSCILLISYILQCPRFRQRIVQLFLLYTALIWFNAPQYTLVAYGWMRSAKNLMLKTTLFFKSRTFNAKCNRAKQRKRSRLQYVRICKVWFFSSYIFNIKYPP